MPKFSGFVDKYLLSLSLTSSKVANMTTVMVVPLTTVGVLPLHKVKTPSPLMILPMALKKPV